METENKLITSKRKHTVFYFAAIFFSAFGYEYIVFIMTVHLYDLSKNALDIGIFTALTFIPRLFSSFMGGIADQFGKGRCFAFSAIMVCILLLSMSNVSDMMLIYFIWFLASFFLTFIVNVRGSLMAEMVSREKYADGNSWTLILLNAAKLSGPLLGGLIAVFFPVKPLIYFACILYFSVSLLAVNMGIDRAAAENKEDFLANAKNGFRFMTEHQDFRRLALIAFSWRLFLGLQLSLFVVYVKSSLGGTTVQYGVFIALMGCGSIAGSLLGPFVIKRIGATCHTAVGFGLHYASFIALGFCSNYYWALGIIFFSYLVFYITIVGVHTTRDKVTPFQIRSSAYGTVTAILTPPAIVSMLVGGYFAGRYGASVVLISAGALALLSLCIILFLSIKKTPFQHR